MLHTVNKSPFERNSLASCLRLADEGSAILLIEDAVVGAIEGTKVSEEVEAAMKSHAVYVLGPDLAARGLDESRLIDGVKVVGYDGFVDLAVEHDAVHAWL
jgi:tRNA 2-thiouridine synthesizing protein B